MGFVKEFKEFAMKGNLIDMAIGIVIGAAFATITKAFIDGIFMPLVGLIFTVDDLNSYTMGVGGATIQIGAFIGAVINFTIVAFVMFMLIKAMNKMKKKAEEAPAAPAAPTKDQELLSEIRDLLKK
jgi:large conductance mechanosensitive channel